jgi:hypothetical protein
LHVEPTLKCSPTPIPRPKIGRAAPGQEHFLKDAAKVLFDLLHRVVFIGDQDGAGQEIDPERTRARLLIVMAVGPLKKGALWAE